MTDRVKVVCVFKTPGEWMLSGPPLEAWHVLRLRALVAQHADPDAHEFVCLADDPMLLSEPWCHPLAHGWPGWWSKMELFKLLGPCLYLDLDSSVVGDLTPLLRLARATDFAMLEFRGTHHKVGSGLMAWRGNVSHLYDAFAVAPQRHMARYVMPDAWGDQAFIRDHHATPDLVQRLLPGQVVSYKLHVRPGLDVSDARVIVHHGRPRPWEV